MYYTPSRFLTYVLQSKNISEKQTAKDLNIDFGNYSRFIHGKRRWSGVKLARLIDYYGLEGYSTDLLLKMVAPEEIVNFIASEFERCDRVGKVPTFIVNQD